MIDIQYIAGYMKRFKRHRDYGFFDQDIRLSKLSQLGDPLEKLNEGVDFESDGMAKRIGNLF